MADNLTRRTLAIVAIGVVVTLSLVGCGGDDDEDATPSSRRRTTTTTTERSERSTTETTENTEDAGTSTTEDSEQGNTADDPTTTAPEPSPTTAPPSTAPPTEAPPTSRDPQGPSTTIAVTEGASSPEEAARVLVSAWQGGDRGRARTVAEPSAVNAIFARSGSSGASVQRCSQDGAFYGCTVFSSEGPFVLRVQGGSMYRVVEITSFND